MHTHTDLGVSIAETQRKVDGKVKSRFPFHAFFKGAEGMSDWGAQAGWHTERHFSATTSSPLLRAKETHSPNDTMGTVLFCSFHTLVDLHIKPLAEESVMQT